MTTKQVEHCGKDTGAPDFCNSLEAPCAHHPKYAEEPFLIKQYFHTERSDDYFCQNSEGKNYIKINKHSTGEGCKKDGCFTTSCLVTTATSLNLLPPFRFSFLSPSRLSFTVFEQHPAQDGHDLSWSVLAPKPSKYMYLQSFCFAFILEEGYPPSAISQEFSLYHAFL